MAGEATPNVPQRTGGITPANPVHDRTGLNDKQAESAITKLLNPKASRERPEPGYDDLPAEERSNRDRQFERDEARRRPTDDFDDEPAPRQSQELQDRDEPEKADAADDDDEPKFKVPESLVDDEPAASDEPLEEVDFEYNGKKYAIPKPIVEGVLRQQDYTRKTEEVQARTRYLAQREQMMQVENSIFAELAPVTQQIQIAQDQIKQLQLQMPDPSVNVSSYLQFDKHIRGLQTQLNELQQVATKRRTELSQQRDQALRSLQQAAGQHLHKVLPRWDEPTQAAVQQHLIEEGYDPEEIKVMYDPRVLKMAHDAALYRKIKAQTVATKRQIKEAAPVVRPQGRPSTATTERGKTEVLVKRARRSGRDTDAINAITQALRGSRKR